MTKPELLLPVASKEMAQMAIHYGADAIYLGAPEFNARGRTEDLNDQDLKSIIDECHLFNVKVYAALNILIFESEREEALLLAKKLVGLGVDALIVQDLGLVSLLKICCPDLRVHASTQMTITSFESMKFIEDLDLKRVVLGREVGLAEIEKITKNTQIPEIEIFIHGALCVSYSGQCFTSESIGGRSANRGSCAQSCRPSYDFYSDGKKIINGHLLSPKDLMGLHEIPEILKLKIKSLKVEGRLKGPQYVAETAMAYRAKIDGQKATSKDMEIAYSRGIYSGWLHGVNHQKLVENEYSSHRGFFVGEVEIVGNKMILKSSLCKLEKGMGLLFVDESKKSYGAILYEIKDRELFFAKNFEHEIKSLKSKNFKCYINSHPARKDKLLSITQDWNQIKRIDLVLKLALHEGQFVQGKINEIPFCMENIIVSKSDCYTNQNEELSALSRTIFKMKEFIIEGNGSISNKEAKLIRRKFVEIFTEHQLKIFQRNFTIPPHTLATRKMQNEESDFYLQILIRNKDQADLLTFNKNHHIILDFDFGRDLSDTFRVLKSKGFKVGIATTRIHKPDEDKNLDLIAKLIPDFFLVRNLGAAYYFKEKYPTIELWGDSSLNVSNSATFNYLINHGFQGLTLSLDLPTKELEELSQNIEGRNACQIVRHYMSSFHMEHCLFAANLSTGTSYKDCGHPCEKHEVKLKDEFGVEHFIRADRECRNTMYLGQVKTQAKIPTIQHLRLEFLNESASEVAKIINDYGPENYLAVGLDFKRTVEYKDRKKRTQKL